MGDINDTVLLNDKVYINDTEVLRKHKFSNIIELYNYYYSMYKKLIENNNNVIFIDYRKIIDKSSAFEYINSKLIPLNICIVSNDKLLKTLDVPAKSHGKNVQTSDSAITSYHTNKINWSIKVNKSKISNSINNTLFDFFEKYETDNEYNNETEVAICL